MSKLCCRSRTFPLIMRFPSAPLPKRRYVRAQPGSARLGWTRFEDALLFFLFFFWAGWPLLGGPEHIPVGAESPQAGRHVRSRLFQQGAHRRLRVHAEKPPLHLRPRGAGECPVGFGGGKGVPLVGGGPLSGLNNSALEMTRVIPQEAAMQLFQCHYRERGLMSGLYFDYVKDILQAAASQGESSLSCKPPPCLNLHPSPGALLFSLYCFLMDTRKAKAAQKPGRAY